MTEHTEQSANVAGDRKRPAGRPRLVAELPEHGAASEDWAAKVTTLFVQHETERAQAMLRAVKEGVEVGRYPDSYLDMAIVEADEEHELPIEDIAAALGLSEDHVQAVLDQAEQQDDEDGCAVTVS
ncbi:hypothetical protein [Kitasatospora sp. GAS1066B]|uniref:hypothetical protein n=1 Tax=Kitasatospora sp. GAS1066B TaxID=3156271 RepID=UPI0035139BA6